MIVIQYSAQTELHSPLACMIQNQFHFLDLHRCVSSTELFYTTSKKLSLANTTELFTLYFRRDSPHFVLFLLLEGIRGVVRFEIFLALVRVCFDGVTAWSPRSRTRLTCLEWVEMTISGHTHHHIISYHVISVSIPHHTTTPRCIALHHHIIFLRVVMSYHTISSHHIMSHRKQTAPRIPFYLFSNSDACILFNLDAK